MRIDFVTKITIFDLVNEIKVWREQCFPTNLGKSGSRLEVHFLGEYQNSVTYVESKLDNENKKL